jgi:3-hydroxyisobutyrate dehydrogenase-like beta-hydroxyacid dehydrogenase
MTTPKVGILHPGQMGISIAASAQRGGCEVYWASEGRSPHTHERALAHGLTDLTTLDRVCQTCDLLISVCPPDAANDVADAVLARSFAGRYLDANAISPQRVWEMGKRMAEAGIDFVDGGIIGPPAWAPDQTWLYLSGAQADWVSQCFLAGPLRTHVLSDLVGDASALKMCYAAWTKGSTALLCGILTTADALGVREALLAQWARDWPDFDGQAVERVRRVTAKAWRFAGEMEEIAATFEDVGLPGGFHAAAANIYRRLAHYKDAPATPDLDDVLDALR